LTQVRGPGSATSTPTALRIFDRCSSVPSRAPTSARSRSILFRDLDEQAFRFNFRTMADAQRDEVAGRAIVGRRVTFKAFTGKELPQTC
jgi:hypothetical protein